jgi:hypothetical protein
MENIEFAGKGGRKPQLDINISIIELDIKNPRLVPYLPNGDKTSQIDLLSVLYENFDTEMIAMSMVQNGYFDEEPIIVVPNMIPSGFKFSNYKTPDELAKEIQILIDKSEISFVVVEGNRRVSTIKLITDIEIRKKIGAEDYPSTTDKEKVKDLTIIPAIIYEKREDVSAYLGVRHIAGLLKWEAFAQAAYTSEVIETEIKKGKDISEAIKEVQKVIGDRSDKLLKQYITHRLFLQAREDIDFDVKPIINKFSLLTVAYNSATLREFIGVSTYSRTDLNSPIVPTASLSNFKTLLTWIFGNEKAGEAPILSDSRLITSKLSHVVTSKSAVEYLKEYKDLNGAFERTNGEREYLNKKLTDATRAIQTSLQFAYKYKDDEELVKKVKELEELMGALKSNLITYGNKY